ncbi:MAG TPA: AI-2E family transporter [Albitalea sp.]|nr:AI-2E family transporter [Albitalea sp.]
MKPNPAFAHPAPPPRSSAAATVIATLAGIAMLWWGQRFLIPLAAGLMLAMLVMPLTVCLQARLRSPVAATVLTLALVMSALAGGAMVFGGQLVRVAERVPEMISMAAQQLAARDPGADSLLTRARDALQELDRAADRAMAAKPLRPARRGGANAAAGAASAAAPNNSITTGATEALRETAVTGSSVLLGFAGTLSIILFIAFFVLIGGKPLTARFLGLWSDDPEAHERAQGAMLECARQIRIYAAVLLVTNTVIGVVVWAVFSIADLPDAAGWGVTAAVLHIVPYLGMALLTGLGAAETYLVHETLGAALGMAAVLVALSTLIGTLVAAWLQGRAAKMNSAAVFIGLVFWGALWGIWGLFLGPALVVMLKVVAEHSLAGRRLAKLMAG